MAFGEFAKIMQLKSRTELVGSYVRIASLDVDKGRAGCVTPTGAELSIAMANLLWVTGAFAEEPRALFK